MLDIDQVSAGGDKVIVWDLLTGRSLAVLQNHQKTVRYAQGCLCVWLEIFSTTNMCR
jgi:hypothetical protein